MASKSTLYPSKSTPLSKSASSPTASTSNLAFATSLSSLLATSASSNNSNPRPPRTSHTKNNRGSIFTSHNRGLKKRALADTSDEPPLAQKHSRTSESIDAATLHRSRRKMEEKARLYASMKRGDYVPPSSSSGVGRDQEKEGLVDFDRKWAEAEEKKNGNEATGGDDTSSDDYDDDDGDELVEYEDEFGRLREGSKAEVAREQRRRNAQAFASAELAEASARPQLQQPDNLIYGDTVQTAAFNPDARLTAQMETLARKRDRSATPPEEVHYDASKEVRTKGVGFFQFSRDKEGRERELRDLEREREETERGRREREERMEERKRKLEERRKAVADKRGEKLAERFLDTLDV